MALLRRAMKRLRPSDNPAASPSRRALTAADLSLRANGRSFDSALTSRVLDSVQAATYHYTYRGLPCVKNPFDLALYTLLIGRLRPRTVMEIGTFHGGSALWFADMLDAHRIEGARVVTVDVNRFPGERDPRITYLTADARQLDEALSPADLAALARPWLVMDDGSHLERDITAFLEWIHPKLSAGDYLVVEDGSLRHFEDPRYDEFDDGPNRAVASFLERHAADYAIDTELCDYFGYNVTWNLNAWLCRR